MSNKINTSNEEMNDIEKISQRSRKITTISNVILLVLFFVALTVDMFVVR